MDTNFKKFVEINALVRQHGAIIFPEHFAWAREIGRQLPAIDLDLPTIQKQAKIEYIMDKKNPIYVQLDDGSKLFFTLDEFKRIHGKPQRGKTMVVQMLRLGHDKSDTPSQIKSCHVF